jgi:hypothetical protein
MAGERSKILALGSVGERKEILPGGFDNALLPFIRASRLHGEARFAMSFEDAPGLYRGFASN